MKFYELNSIPDETTPYSGHLPAGYGWGPPGPPCPACEGTAVDVTEDHPSVAPSERGPFVSTSRGDFAQLLIQNPWLVLMRRDALAQLQAEGILGLKGRRTELRFRQQRAPELLELEISPYGLYHPDCEPPVDFAPCGRCGRYELSRPKQPLLDGGSLPEHLDVFRLHNGAATLVITERFADTLRRLGFEEFSLRELPVR
jgi:uncharacterized double-CXXCG motif protein